MVLPATFEVELAVTAKYLKEHPDEVAQYLPGQLAQLSTMYIRENFRDSVALPASASEVLTELVGLETLGKVENEDTLRRHTRSVVQRYVDALAKLTPQFILNTNQFNLDAKLLGFPAGFTSNSRDRSLVPDGNVLVLMAWLPSS